MLNQKLAAGAVMLLSFFGLFNLQVKAVESNSYYQSEINLGEHIISMENRLNLDYKENLNNYKLRTMLELSKEYRFFDLKFKQGLPFLEGVTREQNLQFDDYLVSIQTERKKLDLGLVNPEASSSFLYVGRLLGGYLKVNNYKIWSGYANSEGLGLASQNNLQFGINYQQDEQQLIYQALRQEESYNQYLSYSDNYSLGDTYLWLDTTLGFNSNDQLAGVANKVQLNSRFKEIGYTVGFNHQAPDFAAVNNRFDTGYGDYGLNLSAHKQLGAYLLNSKLGYTRNNLNRKADEITKQWSNNWRVNYYAQSGVSYFGQLNYSLENIYQTETSLLTKREDNATVKLGGKWEQLNLIVSHGQTVTRAEDKITDRNSNIGLELDYNPQPYSITGNYNWEYQDEWDRNYNLNFNYDRQLKSNLDYSLSFNLQQANRMKLGLNQGLSWQFYSVHNIYLNLNLNRYQDNPDLEQSGYLQYEYRF